MSDDKTPRAALGPYAGQGEPSCLVGRPVAEIEATRLFTAGGLRMRRMVARERVYVGAHTDVWVRIDGQRRVEALLVSLRPPDQDVADDCFEVSARVDGHDAEVQLSYGWALLLQLAHDVLGLSPHDAQQLLNGIYADGFLPRRYGDVELSLRAARRFGHRGERCLCLMARRADAGEVP